MADLHVLVESARSLCYAAADADGDTDTTDSAGHPARLSLLAAAAKAHCAHALTRTAAEMIQMHGAVGITWEHDAHRYFKHAHGAAQLFGRPDEHIARVAAPSLTARASGGTAGHRRPGAAAAPVHLLEQGRRPPGGAQRPAPGAEQPEDQDA